MITRVLVANRAEIASRVFRTCRRLGIETVAVHSDADAGLPYVREADAAVRLPGNAPADTYLRTDLLVDAARRSGVDAVHPGYGFLSENAEFARAVIDAGLTWVGPTPASIDAMGSKIEAKRIMREAGVPVLETPAEPTDADLPLLVKASAGGGGRGMRVVRRLADLAGEVAAAEAEALSAFGDGTVFVEPYVERGRHVEVQVFDTTAIGERDCSLQRRHQKVVEEAPAPHLPADTREAMLAAAEKAAQAIDYQGAGTVEFLVDAVDPSRFWFLEMNTRLQVEHPVTELVYGVDLVEEQLRVASGLPPGFDPAALAPRGHAIELRVNAEDPKRFLPGPGTITTWVEPVGEGVRVDAGYQAGNTVTPYYDSLLAKLIVSAPSRAAAIERARAAVAAFEVAGPKCNLPFFAELLEHPEFVSGAYDTGIVSRMR
jgi:propionyl-CoA carboxylase alpha chain